MDRPSCYTQNVMSWLVIAVTTVHVIVCLILILVVLLQSGKAADLAGAFGGMGSQTVFGPRGTATVLSKATTVAAALFMVTSLSLVIMHNAQTRSSGSVLENRSKKAPVQQQQQKPAPTNVLPTAPVAPVKPH
jgi:preprotein translocase subunit SecG